MRDLTADQLAVLLSVFAVLLVAFGIDFHLSRRAALRHRRGAITFAVVSLIGEFATAIALVLTWVAVWSPTAWERIDNMLVFVPGSLAMLCAVIITAEKAIGRVIAIVRTGTVPGADAKAPERTDADSAGDD